MRRYVDDMKEGFQQLSGKILCLDAKVDDNTEMLEAKVDTNFKMLEALSGVL